MTNALAYLAFALATKKKKFYGIDTRLLSFPGLGATYLAEKSSSAIAKAASSSGTAKFLEKCDNYRNFAQIFPYTTITVNKHPHLL
jgi:hypothetical protein